MKNSIRLVVLACATVLSLAFAGGALATPRVEIFQSRYALGGTAPLDLIVSQDASDAAPARVQILVPTGYSVNLGQPVGATIGGVTARASATIAGAPVLLPLKGPIVNANPADFTASSTQCTGRPLHTNVWILQLKVSTETLPVPVYVDATGPPGVAATLLVCLPSPYVPESSGGARFGAQLLFADLHLTGVFTNPADAARYVWRVVTTPYVMGTATANPPQTVEARALVPYPAAVTLKRLKSKKPTLVILGGIVVDETGPRPGQSPTLLTGSRASVFDGRRSDKKAKSLGNAGRVNNNGAFKRSLKASRATRFFQAVLGPFDASAYGCTAPVIAPAGCVSATISEVDSPIVKVPGYRPPKKRR